MSGASVARSSAGGVCGLFAVGVAVKGELAVMLFFILLGIVVLGGIAVVAAGQGDGLEAAPIDRAPFDLPTERLVSRPDVDRLRFSVGLRGYRMDEVDEVLDRLAVDIEQRDLEIAVLRAQAAPSAERATPVQGAAFVVPETVASDQPTERTLFVPLDAEDEPGA